MVVLRQTATATARERQSVADLDDAKWHVLFICSFYKINKLFSVNFLKL